MKMRWIRCNEVKDGSVRFLGPIDGSLLRCRSGFPGQRSARFEKDGGGLIGRRNHDIGYWEDFQNIPSIVIIDMTVSRAFLDLQLKMVEADMDTYKVFFKIISSMQITPAFKID